MSKKEIYANDIIICEGKIHFLAYGLPFFLFAVFFAFFILFHFYFPVPENKAFLAASLFCLLYGVLKKKNLEVLMTDDRFLIKKGVFSTGLTEIKLRRIESFTMNQTIAERVTGGATIIVHGVGNSVIEFPTLINYEEMSDAFSEWQDEQDGY